MCLISPLGHASFPVHIRASFRPPLLILSCLSQTMSQQQSTPTSTPLFFPSPSPSNYVALPQASWSPLPWSQQSQHNHHTWGTDSLTVIETPPRHFANPLA